VVASAAVSSALPEIREAHCGERHAVEVDVRGDGTSLLVFETGLVGKQASGAVMVRSGGTVVYNTACYESPEGDFDFIPLRIDYQERQSSGGRTKGGYLKRDGRPSEGEILVSRLIDRPLRPMIAEGWRHDTQLLSWVLSYDGTTVPDPLSICGAAAALAVSDIPLTKPVAAVEVGMNPDSLAFIVNPSRAEAAASPLLMTIAGTAEGVLMIEGAADFLTEAQMVAAVQVGHEAVGRICDAVGAWAAEVGKEKKTGGLKAVPPELKAALLDSLGDRVFTMLRMTDPEVGATDTSAARAEMDALSTEAQTLFAEEYGSSTVKVAFKKLCSRKMRELVRDTSRRCDGRGVTDVRPISIDCGILPHPHGSALFTRGATQAIATATLGSNGMQQKGEDLDGETSKRFYLQYSFPPCSVGEVGRVGAPGRREVGHGNLAERALAPIIPPESSFPYSMRVESLITESSGSSSMASVCGGCLALMDAGVPIERIVAGVAMGLILDEDGGGDEPVILTDILGLEDGLGTMDFKVAGDATGISTFQLDIKCEGLSIETLERALEQARQGRMHILGEMQRAMPEARARLPSSVPKLVSVDVPTSSIGKLIGPGGKTIRSIIEEFGLNDMNVGDEGRVTLSGYDDDKLEAARSRVEDLAGATPTKPSYTGKLTC
jgi:polyribonucleotide nucleotidyltransferase